MTAVRKLCIKCRGDKVTFAAWASWDVLTQTWLLEMVMDSPYCEDCDTGTTTVDEELGAMKRMLLRIRAELASIAIWLQVMWLVIVRGRTVDEALEIVRKKGGHRP